MKPIDTRKLREHITRELATRAMPGRPGAFRYVREGKRNLFGTTGALSIMAALGVPFSEFAGRTDYISTLLGYQNEDGCFTSKRAGHALCLVVQSFNLLAADIPENVQPLAPLDLDRLPAWLESCDWTSTHKEYFGSTAPLLAEGLVSSEWISVFREFVAGMVLPDRPLHTWCAPEDSPSRVISCIYHVLEPFDAGCIEYPHADLLLDRLLGLDWPSRRPVEKRTRCTDADWAWNLAELCKLRPHRLPQAMDQIRQVSNQRVREWSDGQVDLSTLTTHHISCFLWSTALFQKLVRDHFTGPWLRDTQNDPALYRLGRKRSAALIQEGATLREKTRRPLLHRLFRRPRYHGP